MAQRKKGLITRILEGKEKSEEYARSTLPTNRWQLFWDVFKGNFGKIVKVNLLILLFFLPLIAFLIVNNMVVENNAYFSPFSANVGAIKYPFYPEQSGVAELIALQNSVTLYVGVLVCSIIGAVGLAGGMYVIRNMVWTEGIFVANDFWRGIRLNFKNALQVALIFSLTLFLSGTMIASAEYNIKMEKGIRWLMVTSEVFSYIFIIVISMMCFWMISLGVNYKLTFFQMIRNSFLLMIGTLIQTVFFIAIALVPFLLLFLDGQFFTVIAFVIVALFGFAYALLVWIDFSQWAFDQFINPKLSGAKVGRGIYNKDGTPALTGDDSSATIEYQRIILAHGKSRLMARPIKPIDDSLKVYELPQSFSREDLKKLRESKENIAEDTAAYVEEHKNDLRYVEYNKQFEERERALQDSDNKKKKRKPPKLLGQ